MNSIGRLDYVKKTKSDSKMLDKFEKKALRYLTYNLHWQELGWKFDEIMQARSQLRDIDPFLDVGIREINSEIGSSEVKKYTSHLEFKRLKYLYLDEADFDGDLTFLKYCPNLEYLFILGISVNTKIKNLTPISNLDQLQFLHLEYHNIEDLTPLKNLINLKYLHLRENPIKSIEPVCNLKNLKEANFTSANEKSIIKLLKHSPVAQVKFYNQDIDLSLSAYWIEDWAYGTSYFKDYDILQMEIFPLMKYTKIVDKETKGLMQQKLAILANQLLRADEEISNISFSNKKGSSVIKGHFSYSRKGE
ncbi:MAG: hypothetical protein JJE07_05475 [Flavobacteriaceae bacterium]|nr:hypothetical protein [Flavobacteriaceae bacterium]